MATIVMPIFPASATARTMVSVIEAHACVTLDLLERIAPRLWLAPVIVLSTENVCLEPVTASRATRATIALANCPLVPTRAMVWVNVLTMCACVLLNIRARIVPYTTQLFRIVPTTAPLTVTATVDALAMRGGLEMIARVVTPLVQTDALVLAFVVKTEHVNA